MSLIEGCFDYTRFLSIRIQKQLFFFFLIHEKFWKFSDIFQRQYNDILSKISKFIGSSISKAWTARDSRYFTLFMIVTLQYGVRIYSVWFSFIVLSANQIQIANFSTQEKKNRWNQSRYFYHFSLIEEHYWSNHNNDPTSITLVVTSIINQ